MILLIVNRPIFTHRLHRCECKTLQVANRPHDRRTSSFDTMWLRRALRRIPSRRASTLPPKWVELAQKELKGKAIANSKVQPHVSRPAHLERGGRSC